MQKQKKALRIAFVALVVAVLITLPAARAVHEARSVYLVAYPLVVGYQDRDYDMGVYLNREACTAALHVWSARIRTDLMLWEGGALVVGCYPVNL